MSGLLHIASFVIQHRSDATAALDVALVAAGGCEVTAREGANSVVVCEGDSEREVVARIEALRDVAGVYSISLIYHHAEPRDAMYEEIVDANPS
jgi:periplasmic nitrate reductase NapD